MTKNNAINAPLPIAATKGGTAQTTYAKGDMLYASASNTLSKLAISTTAGSPLASNGSIPSWGNSSTTGNIQTDFIVAASVDGGNPAGFNLDNTESGDVVMNGSTTAQSSTNPGVAGITTGGTTTGAQFYGCWSAPDAAVVGPILFGGGTYSLKYLIKFSALSDGSNTYIARIGFGSTKTGDQNNGCYFEYTHSVNSGNYTIKTAASSVRTTANTANAASATNWQELRIDVNAAGTSVSFFVDGVECTNSPIATNIPTGAVGPFLQITKSAGTTARLINVDYYNLRYTLTTPR